MTPCKTDWRIMRKGYQATIRARITINGQQFTEFAPITGANIRAFRSVVQAKMRVRLQIKLNAHYGKKCYIVAKVFEGAVDA